MSSYQVIARKYRPQRFADVVGQEHVTRTLSNAIERDRIAHAYLFCGPRGTGKTTVARIFAKCLNATNGPRVDFAEDDPRCQEIAEGRSLDVIEIDAASNRGIDEIRELRDTARYAPSNSKFKIYIVDEVHMLTKEAFNALLKTLEEPPAHVKFMFATTDPEKVLPTILSRCQRFDLRRIPSSLIIEHLGAIAKKEGITIDSGALDAIARGADGGMRDAESTLDQLISFCGDNVQEGDVLSMFGLTARSQLIDLAQAMLAGDVEGSLRLLDELARSGKDLGRLMSDLLGHFRNLLIYQVSRGDMTLLEVSEAEATALVEQSKAISQEAFSRIMEILTDGESRLRDANSKKILLEVTVIKAIQARNAASIDQVLQTLQQLRSEGGASGPGGGAAAPAGATGFAALRKSLGTETGSRQTAAAPAARVETRPEPAPAPVTPAAAPAPAPAPAPVAPVPQMAAPAPAPRPAAAPAASKGLTGEELETLWQELVESVGRASPFIKAALPKAHPVSFDGKTFVIGFDPEFHDDHVLVDTPRNITIFQTKLQEQGHHEVWIKVITADHPVHRARPAREVHEVEPEPTRVAAPTAQTAPAQEAAPAAPPRPEPPPPQPMDMQSFKNDPLIKAALEIFKGQIVDIRV